MALPALPKPASQQRCALLKRLCALWAVGSGCYCKFPSCKRISVAKTTSATFQHLQSPQHKRFALDDSQYAPVDHVISQLTNNFVEQSTK